MPKARQVRICLPYLNPNSIVLFLAPPNRGDELFPKSECIATFVRIFRWRLETADFILNELRLLSVYFVGGSKNTQGQLTSYLIFSSVNNCYLTGCLILFLGTNSTYVCEFLILGQQYHSDNGYCLLLNKTPEPVLFF